MDRSEIRRAAQRVLNMVMDSLEEEKNSIGGVIGYRINLSPAETEALLRAIEALKSTTTKQA